MSTSSTRIRLRISRPAPTSSTHANAISDTTSALRTHAAPAAFGRTARGVLQRVVSAAPRACSAGARPNTMPVSDRDRQREAERGGIRPHVAQQRNADGVQPRERARAADREHQSRGARRCRRARCLRSASARSGGARPAPSAVRIAISFCRDAVRASSRFERLAHTISITIADRAREHPDRQADAAADLLGERLHVALEAVALRDAPP